MEFEFIQHKSVSEDMLQQIISLKNMLWCYPYESHVKWIQENLRPDDLHLVLYDKDKLIGYVNLVNLNLTHRGG